MFKTGFIFLMILLSAIPVFSQNGEYCLKLVNKSDPEKVRYIYEGKRISLIDKNNNKTTGKCSIENDSIVMVADTAYFLSDITTVRGKSTGLLVVRIFGGALGAFGLMMVGAAGSILLEAVADNSLSSVILIPLGLITAALGVTTTFMGISVSFVNGKKYDLTDKWNINIAPATEMDVK